MKYKSLVCLIVCAMFETEEACEFLMLDMCGMRKAMRPQNFKSCSDGQVDSRSALERFAMDTCQKAEDGVMSIRRSREDFS